VRVKLLKVLYNLLLIDAVPIKLLTCEKDGGSKQTEMSERRRSSLTNDFVDLSIDAGGGNEESKEDGAIGEMFFGYMDEDESQVKSRFGISEKG
jgi:hypothetical protein